MAMANRASPRCLLILALTISLWMVRGSFAAGHSVLVRAEPPPNAAREVAPREVRLWFTEPIDPPFSTVTVLDAQGRQVSGPPTVSDDRRQMGTVVGLLTPGPYTVKWRVLSTVDSHPTTGFFLFAIGLPTALGPESGGMAAPQPSFVAVRWIALLAALLLTGITLFPLAVFRPGLRGLDPLTGAHVRARLTYQLGDLMRGCAVLVFVTTVAELFLTAVVVFDASPSDVLSRGLLWPLLAGTHIGWSILVRMPLALLILLPAARWGQILQSIGLMLGVGIVTLAVLFRGPAALADPSHVGHLTLIVGVPALYGLVQAVRQPPQTNWMPLLAAGGILGGLTLTAHAVGSGGTAMVADWLHLSAAGAWLGGLASLAVALRNDPLEGTPQGKIMVRRFSTLAGLSLAILTATGAYATWLHVPTLHAMVLTAYGQALLVKLVFVLPLICLGAIHHVVARRRLEALTGAELIRQQRRLRVTLGVEVALGAAVLAATAVLTQLPPARTVFPATASCEIADKVITKAPPLRRSLVAALPSLPLECDLPSMLPLAHLQTEEPARSWGKKMVST